MLQYKKIMCAFEFDGNSTAALLLSSTLAKESDATLYVVHIARVPIADMDVPLPFDADPRWEKEARSKLAQIVKETLKPEVQCVIEVRTGVPNLDIVRAARELGVDLIVMVTHGRTGLEHFVLGSVTEHVIREAPCPVLVLHHTAPATGPAQR
jgi:universal stress protein A